MKGSAAQISALRRVWHIYEHEASGSYAESDYGCRLIGRHSQSLLTFLRIILDSTKR